MKPITMDTLEQLRSAYCADAKAKVVRNALTKNDITLISRSFEAENSNPHIFTIDLKTMPATAQMASGR
ncbi:MAG: peptidase C1, partial [Erysipelotrichaceae bacterium]|nr:peptidase C1 [Erysipelotrichaceae bacterium]